MKSITTTKVFIALVLIVGVLVGYANEMRIFDSSFVEAELREKPIQEVKTQYIEKRNIASAEADLPAIQYIPFNQAFKAQIKGQWQVKRIINAKKEVILDVNSRAEDRNKKLILDFDLVGTSLVKATFKDKEGEENFFFDISIYKPKGKTIALYRAYGKGYEIFEAEKVVLKSKPRAQKFKPVPSVKQRKENTNIADNVKQVIKKKTFLKYEHVNATLKLERVVHPGLSKAVLKGDNINGSITFGEDTIESLSADITVGGNTETIEIPFSNINNVGHFSYQTPEGKTVSGLVTNNGPGGYRVRLVNGKNSGAMLSFVTDEEMQRIEDAQIEAELLADSQDNYDEEVEKETQERKDEEADSERALSSRDDILAAPIGERPTGFQFGGAGKPQKL
ncbi:MAG: hypothetical protein ACPGJV_14400 [Bacteriovoracaceae bacterium]